VRSWAETIALVRVQDFLDRTDRELKAIVLEGDAVSELEFEGVFDEDYLYFFETFLAERTPEEVERIVELLELQHGAEILDCPCGHGRISNALAARGYRVTGLDATELFLERAREDAAARGVLVEYVHGDMRELPWRERFDGLVNWFTSFGYFSDWENNAVLRGFHEALKPGGRLVLETQNVSRILLDPQPLHVVGEREGDLMIDRWTLDAENARFRTERLVMRDGCARKAHFSVRWFTPPELRSWLEDAGFENVRMPGLTPETRLVVVADRAR
jgi:2-polyprenyl-3-methyl-5-hydroxy-6-metoxy-1,4-benzoquinol methylase